MIPRRWALVALIPAILAGGCESEDPRALLGFTLFPTADQGLDPAAVAIRFDDGRSRGTVTGEDFSGTDGRLATREFETRTSGTLRVDVTVRDGAEEIAEGGVEIPLRPDWRWGVSLSVDDDDPADTCFGCFGSAAFAVAESHRRSPSDSLWVVWGGNSISDPVVY